MGFASSFVASRWIPRTRSWIYGWRWRKPSSSTGVRGESVSGSNDVAEVLSSLRDRGYRLGVLTNGSEDQQLGKLSATGVAEFFDVVCISETIGVQKPDSRAFDTLARSLEVESHQCLFIGDDFDQDVVGATAAGMQAFLIERRRKGARGLSAVIEAALV